MKFCSKRIFFLFCCFVSFTRLNAQFVDSATGLLQTPSGEMQKENTFMITNNFINYHSLSQSHPFGWEYNTFAYGFSYTFWSRLELGYVLTILNGAWNPSAVTHRQKIVRNQDRHFYGRFQIIKEGDFGISWLPSLIIGTSDPATSATSSGDIETKGVEGEGNGYFNRNYIVMTKHFSTNIGEIAAHVGYQYNKRTDYPINAPCAAVAWKPIWLDNIWLINNINFIFEFDSRTLNFGFIASIWNNRFEAMFELQKLQWINFGLRYKLVIQ